MPNDEAGQARGDLAPTLQQRERKRHLWRQTVENSLTIARDTFRLEDLVASGDARMDFLDRLDVKRDDRPLPHSNKGRGPSEFDDWDAGRKRAFREVAGDLMDRFYPGWED